MLSNHYTKREIDKTNRCVNFLIEIFTKISFMYVAMIKFMKSGLINLYFDYFNINENRSGLYNYSVVSAFLIISCGILVCSVFSLGMILEIINNRYNRPEHIKLKICVIIPLMFFLIIEAFKYLYKFDTENRRVLKASASV